MNILHIAHIGNGLAYGTNVVVPKHVREQSAYADVGLLNISDEQVKNEFMLTYPGIDKFPDDLPKPFDRPDIVVFHEVNYIEYIKMYKKLVARNIPYIIVPHGENTKTALRRKFWKKKIAYILLFNRFIRKSLGLQCLSKGEYDQTETSDRKFIVPNGMDLHEKLPAHSERKEMRLLYIGRLDWEQKGLDILIEAVGTFENPELRLDIFGPDIVGRRAVVQGLIDKFGAADRIAVHDPIYGKEKERLYSECDVFIQTSRFEGLPLGVLEAMSYGKPVLVTKGTNLAEEVDLYDAGFTAGNDVAGVKTALERAFNAKKSLGYKGDNAHRLVSEEFAWDKIAKKAVETYGRLLDDGTQGAALGRKRA